MLKKCEYGRDVLKAGDMPRMKKQGSWKYCI